MHSQEHVEREAEMHGRAKLCTEAAEAAGIPVADVKEAAASARAGKSSMVHGRSETPAAMAGEMWGDLQIRTAS